MKGLSNGLLHYLDFLSSCKGSGLHGLHLCIHYLHFVFGGRRLLVVVAVVVALGLVAVGFFWVVWSRGGDRGRVGPAVV
ncbi:hypothetical protein Hanom_Chr01g00025851 [Helianthus anomalus]